MTFTLRSQAEIGADLMWPAAADEELRNGYIKGYMAGALLHPSPEELETVGRTLYEVKRLEELEEALEYGYPEPPLWEELGEGGRGLYLRSAELAFVTLRGLREELDV